MTGGLKVLLKFKGSASKPADTPSASLPAPLSSDAKSKKRKGRADDVNASSKKQALTAFVGRPSQIPSPLPPTSQQNTTFRLPIPGPFKHKLQHKLATPLLDSLHAVSTPVSNGAPPALPPKFKFKVPEPSPPQRNEGHAQPNGSGQNAAKPRSTPTAKRGPQKREKAAPKAKGPKPRGKVAAAAAISSGTPPIQLTVGSLKRDSSISSGLGGFGATDKSRAEPVFGNNYDGPAATKEISINGGSAGLGGPQSKRGGSSGGIDRGELLKVVDYIQKKDKNNIFKNPVTDEEAPDYSTVIKQPMDFTTMRSKVSQGAYATWDDLNKDVELMFTNCMTYNPSTSFYFKEARTLLAVSSKVFELAKQGVRNFRGRTNAIVRAHNQKIAMEEREEREAQKTKAPKPPAGRVASLSALQKEDNQGEQKDTPGTSAPPRFKNTARPMVKDTDGRRPLMMDENLRTTYRPRVGASTGGVSVWGGLANGASGEGTSFASGRPVLKQVANQSSNAYLYSIARFMAGCSDAVREHVLGGLVDCIAVEAPKPRPAPQQQTPLPNPPSQVSAPAPPPSASLPTSQPPPQTQSQPTSIGIMQQQPAQSTPPPQPQPQQQQQFPPLPQAAAPRVSQPEASTSGVRLPSMFSLAHITPGSQTTQPPLHQISHGPSMAATILQKHFLQHQEHKQQQQQQQQQQLLMLQGNHNPQEALQMPQTSSIFTAFNQTGLSLADTSNAAYTPIQASSQNLTSYPQPSAQPTYLTMSQPSGSTPYPSQQQPNAPTISRALDPSMHQHQSSFLTPSQHHAQAQQQQQLRPQTQHHPQLYALNASSLLQQQATGVPHGQSLGVQRTSSNSQQQQQLQHLASAGHAVQYLQQHLLPPR